MAVKRDVTESLQLEEQLHQAQKMESIGRLAGGVAHDLNNLLSPILGYSEMLLEERQFKGDLREPVEEIVNAGRRARSLVRQLLAFSRRQTLQFQPININDLLTNFQKLLRRTIREDITLHLDPAPGLPQIRGDIGQLEQVIMNLAVNAQDAMPTGGALSLATASADIDEAYASRKRGVTPGRYVRITISDTGSGMDARTLENLFEPFFTTKEVGKGTGLGLSTAYGIVKQHGGNIWAYSEPGLGSSIKIYLPAAEDSKQAEAAASEKTPAPDQGGSETILIAEDDLQVRNLALTVLKRKGYTVLSASNGAEALEKLKAHKGPVHLLLTDVIMPDSNGKELYEQIADIRPDIRVLYMSGYTDDALARHGIVDSRVNFIEKPFSVKFLAAKVRTVLDQSL